MAVFFDHKVQSPVQGQFTDIQWHKTAPLLAVACVAEPAGNGVVNLFMEEGEHVSECQLKRSKPATLIQWHPVKKILAAGWATGEISLWNQQERDISEVFPLHKHEITILQWSSNGSRLLSGDSQGLLILWKVDSRGQVQQTPICQHNLQEELSECVLRPPPPVDPNNDIAALARAAVSGDESALDMFNWKKGKSNTKFNSLLGPSEAMTFYIGSASGESGGTVTYLNSANKPVKQFSTEGPVRRLLFYTERSILVTVTTNMMLTQHSVSDEGDCTEMLKVKLSGKPDSADVLWASTGVLAQCTGETVIRMWDVDKEENFVLTLESNKSYDRTECINCVAYSQQKNILAGGTSAGHVAMWKFSSAGQAQEPEDRWTLQPPSVVDGVVSDIVWGSSKSLLAVNTIDEAVILSEQVMSAHCYDQTSVVQTGPMSLSVDIFSTNSHQDLKTDIQIKGVYTTKDTLAVWDYRRTVVYEVNTQPGEQTIIRAAGTFSTETLLVCLYEQNVYTIDEPLKVQVRTHQGTVKQLLSFNEPEGNPCFIDVCNKFLVVATDKGCLRLYDLSRREAKQVGSTKNLAEVISDLGSIESAKCNCNGSRVSIIINKVSGKPDPKLYVWDVELDTLQYFNFESGHSEQDELIARPGETDQDLSEEERGKNQAARDIAGRHAISHMWDQAEPKLLVCEARELVGEEKTKKQKDAYNEQVSLTKATMKDTVEIMIVSLFVTQENGVVIQDSFSLSKKHSSMLGVNVPYYYFTKKADVTIEAETTEDGMPNFSERPTTSAPPEMVQARASRRVMRDFIGLENAEKTAHDAMMNFSFYLTIGNMDEAFKAIKLIKSESVWENMAKMCVKNRRLDVAAVCLGNMQHARGAKALREAQKEPELDAKVAVLAMQLGQHEDAERLFKNCKRYDLLNMFYQSTGQWGRALETAEMYDRVHLRTTYYNYAKHLEAKGDINGAIPNYEKSDTHRFEVPRMLFDEPSALEAYIMKTKDKTLRKWWAQYMESSSEMSTALQFYESAQDVLSLVRVYCYCGQIDKAAEICNTSGDKAACYHLARQYENNEQFKDAVHFFTRAGAYGNAIRLSKEGGGEDQLMNLALLGKSEDMVEAARHYEDKPGCQDKAVMLYHKAGHFSKALDLAFQSKQFAALQVVSEDLDESTDPQLLQRCADFFIENSQFDRAVDLLALAKRYWDSLKICMEQHVPMTEDLVEKLTPSKEMGEAQPDERNKILEGIAEVCMQQREYHLATKKYTQAGNKLKAMKALLKSGDTEKIVFFAGVSRQKEIYVMAANYLQSLDWRKDPEIMKNIIGFYTKGRALDSLASFYDACAQVEIDEYQNYEKAAGALNEAIKCLSKAKVANTSIQEERLGDMQRRLTLMKKFIQAKRVYEDDPDEAVKQVQVLMEENNVDVAVRVGDMCGLLIEHFARKQKWQAAFNCIEELRARMPRVNVAYYVNMKTIEQIHRALDLPVKDAQQSINGYRNTPEEEMGEEVEEEVPEMYD